MNKILIYTKDHCPYCIRAKKLLTDKQVEFEEINLEGQFQEIEALKEKTQFRTLPQIFVGDTFVGGFQELSAFEATGELDRLIKVPQ